MWNLATQFFQLAPQAFTKVKYEKLLKKVKFYFLVQKDPYKMYFILRKQNARFIEYGGIDRKISAIFSDHVLSSKFNV